MIKNLKKILVVFMFILITTMTTQKTYAAFLDEKYFNKSNPYSGTFSLLLSDLMSSANWNMLCSEHNQHLPSINNINNAYSGASNNYDSIFNTIEWLKSYSSSEASNPYVGMVFHSDQQAYYSVKSNHVCTPKAAYILNHMQEGVNSYGAPGNYTDIQSAWYNVINGGSNTSTLYTQASAYQNFIKKIAKNKNNVDKPDTYVTKTHTFENGTKVSIKFPEIDTSKISSMLTFNTVGKNNKIKKDGNSWAQNVTVSYNEKNQKYMIGPFSINYIESNSNGVDFGAIEGFEIYTDASTKPLSKDQWRFVWLDGQREEGDDFAYPHKDEVFYIEMDYIENATMINGIDVDYKYLVAGAEYQTLEGTYDQYNWKVKCDTTTETVNEETVTKYNWYFEAKNQNIDAKSQKLALADKAARWYETAKIEIRANQGSLEIEKKAIDESGNELTADQVKEKFGEYQYFDFKIKITHSNGEVENDVVTVRAGSSLITGPYSWDGEDTAPTFEVEEIPVANDQWEFKSITPQSGTLKNGGKVTVTAVNQIKNAKHNKIQITKTLSGEADEDEEFKFSVVITMPDGTTNKTEATITVPKGQITGNVWTSDEYYWYGDKAPTYEITEIETEASKKYNPVINPSKGTLDGSGATIEVNALNNEKIEDHIGYLTLEKVLQQGQVTEDTFDFKVTVNGVKNTESGTETFDVLDVKAGDKRGPYKFVWEGDTAPTFTVEEIKHDEIENITIKAETDGGKSVGKQEGNKITGQLVEKGSANIDVTFTNGVTKHSGGIKVIKDIETTEKISKESLEQDGTKFEIEVVIEGTFIYDGVTYQDTKKTFPVSLPNDGKWEYEMKDIVWFGSKAPTFTVTEKNIPTGWRCKTISYSDLADKDTSSEGHSLIDDKTIEATIVNVLPSDIEIDLTFSMAGIVWVDNAREQKNEDEYYNSPNGVYDEWDTLKENAEVTVYRVVYDASGNEVGRTVATAYKDKNKNEVQFPIITKADGKWDVPRINVPALTADEESKGYSVSYDVEFVYDGETYTPTDFLAYQIASDGTKTKNTGTDLEKAQAYRNAKTSVKDKYARDSMALEVSNNAKRIAEVFGKSEIDANGDTTGIVKIDGIEKEVKYSSDNAGTGYPTISKVNTTDSYGRVLDTFKAAATTSAGNLTFPFDVDGYDGSSLTETNTTIDENGVHHKYKFIAVYNYCLNINLGLQERATVDVGLTKKLDNAKVVVKEKMYQYNYSGNYDLTEEKVTSLDKNIKVDNAESEEVSVGYTLGLYRSDYYYRAEMYKNGEDSSMYDRLDNFYKTLDINDPTVQDTEMDIYLTYKIKLMNNASAYDVQINSLNDYYDSSFTLVREAESKHLKTQTIAGVEKNINDTITIANASDYADKWTDAKTGIVGSDKDADGKNIIYNKMTASDLGIKLAPGESKEIIVTFKVNKKDSDEAKNAIVLGQKCNVAEIGSYSTFDKGTTNNAGKIDRDSAPGNVNIAANNTKVWYEDDTFAAPRIKVTFVDGQNDRTINGTAWEDNSKDTNTENPGYNQQVGNGVMDNGEEKIQNLTTELVEKVIVQNEDGSYTEYDYIWPTSQSIDGLNGKTIEQVSGLDSTIVTSDKGEYTFTNVPAGDYVVRFTYGNDKDNKIESADYSTSKYYNGQDYKSTKFNGILKGDTTELKADSYLDIDKTNAATDKTNTAIDNEARRLQVVKNSREITYQNGVVMAEYQDDLFSKYTMYAETPKLDMNVEPSAYQGTGSNTGYTYAVNNVNFGLEERPITQLSLDKQIEEITLTTSDGTIIMDAKYNISYKVDDKGEITADVTLDEANSYGTDNLQALNRDAATNQGFRYINVDTSILEGTTINVRYKFTVLNTGEVDRTGELANIEYSGDIETIENARNELLKNLATYKKDGNSLKNDTALGKYVGSIYYYGANGSQDDKVVTSTVRQLVDYIDNDVTFSGMLNASTDTSWSNVTTAELKELINPNIIKNQDGKDVILDEVGVQYETDNRNNLAVSVDSIDGNSTLNNKGFIIELVPYVVDNQKCQASMYLTTTRYVGADSDDLQIDNIAEIIKYNNKVGRRDVLTISGNQDPATALTSNPGLSSGGTISDTLVYERDTSATEVITLSPPTGSGLLTWKLQVIAATTAGLAIIAGGIILIKKKILK